MYLIEIKLLNNKKYKIKVHDSKALGKLIQASMKTCHYIKILEEHINDEKGDIAMYEVEIKEKDKTYHEKIQELKELKELLLKYPSYTSFEAKNQEVNSKKIKR